MVNAKCATYNNRMRSVITTDEHGATLGTCEIIAAHTNGGTLHRAFSVFVFTPDKTKLLIQQRAPGKMLWAGYWANTCCSHPKDERPIEEEAATRLQEECGFRCPLTAKESFVYKADDPSGKGTEYEYDTVMVGTAEEDTPMNADPEEIADMKWVSISELTADMKENPDSYAPWFHLALPLALDA